MFSTFKQSKSFKVVTFISLALVALFAFCLKANLDVDCELSKLEKVLINKEGARKSIKHFLVIATDPYSTAEIHLRDQDTIFVELNGLQGDKNERLQKLIEKATSEGISPIWCPDCSYKIFGLSIPRDLCYLLFTLVLAAAGMFLTPKMLAI